MKPQVPELEAVVLYHRRFCNVVAEEITAYGKDVNRWLDGTRKIMYAMNLIGLSGPEVGVFHRYFLVNLGATQPVTFEMLNPVIEDAFGVEVGYVETCSSLPGAKALVRRPKHIRLSWRDRQWHEQRDEFSGFEAMLLQHMVDHLDGVYFVDRVSGLLRDMAMRRFAKACQQLVPENQ